MLRFFGNNSILKAAFFGICKDSIDTPSKNKQCHLNFRELSSFWAKLDPAGSKNNEILEINVLQNLHQMLFTRSSRKTMVISVDIFTVFMGI